MISDKRKWEVAILRKKNIRAKPADLPNHVSSNQHTRDPKARNGSCKRYRCAAIDSTRLLIASSVYSKTATVHSRAVHQTCVREADTALVLQLFERLHLPFKFFRNPNVIRIQE